MELILVRHGETEENFKGIIQGQLHGALSQRGKEQAKLVCRHLSSLEIDYVFSSDLLRVRDTFAEYEELCAVPFRFEEGLRERSFGVFEGRSREEYLSHARAHRDGLLGFSPEGGESFAEFTERVVKAANALISQVPHGKRVLFLCHGGVIRVLYAHFKSISDDHRLNIEIGNASITRVSFLKGGAVESVVDPCMKHLDECLSEEGTSI